MNDDGYDKDTAWDVLWGLGVAILVIIVSQIIALVCMPG